MNMHPAAACTIALVLHLQLGAQLVQHSSYDDRIAWVLPPDKLAGFAKSGVVIDEDQRTTIVARATISSVSRGLATMRGSVYKTSVDVPRRRTRHSSLDFTSTVTPRNDVMPARALDLEEIGVTEYPSQQLCVGQTWIARLPVITTLGSGVVTITHTVVSFDGPLVELEVHGTGVISGVEYNLPRLLPGTISFHGSAWIDRVTGLPIHESYVIRNRLIRTVRGKTIGFDEKETVETTDHETVAARRR